MKQTDSIEKTAAALTAGKPVVFPTDTVYGIGVAVGLAKTPQVLYDIKRRDSDKAIPWLVGKKSALAFYGRDVPAYALAAAEKFWPGPLTLIVKAARQCARGVSRRERHYRACACRTTPSHSR